MAQETSKSFQSLGGSNSSDVTSQGSNFAARPIYCPIEGYTWQSSHVRFLGWKTQQSQLNHVAKFHLTADPPQCPSQGFMSASKLWVCSKCLVFASLGNVCRRCKQGKLTSDSPSMGLDEAPHSNYMDPGLIQALPPLEEVLMNPTSTIRHVPKALRALWNTTFCRTMETLLMMLPKAVLGVPQRAGRKNKKRNVGLIRQRMIDWQHQNFPSLWQTQTHTGANRTHQPKLPKGNVFTTQRVIELAREGAYSKAMQAITPSTICPYNAETYQKLQALHPRRYEEQLSATNANHPLPISTTTPQADQHLHMSTISILRSTYRLDRWEVANIGG